MNIISVYLEGLQGKIFKLLPMREDYDAGVDNHLPEYLNSLCDSLDGWFLCWPELSREYELIDVQNNMMYLKTKETTFAKWRSVVLRSTRIVHGLLEKYSEKEG